MIIKKILLISFALLCILSVKAQVLVGDMNDDGDLTITDVTESVNIILGKTTKHYLNPYKVDNTAVVGTWWKSKSESITFNEDGTTDYGPNYKYKYMPNIPAVLIYDVSNTVVTALEVFDLTSDQLILSPRGSSSLLTYSKTQADPNLLPGKFTVNSSGKQVQFTRGNLYWDGGNYKLEDSQTAYPTSWSTTHVGHFFWTTLTDYQSGNASYMPYAATYSYSPRSTSDKFWCGEDNPLTVEGTSGLYTLTGDSGGEWYYLIKSRTNASSLYKLGVSVNGVSNCLVIAPDNYTGTIASSYDEEEWTTAESDGLVCLALAGNRNGSTVKDGGSYGYYWSATPSSGYGSYAVYPYITSTSIYPAYSTYRSYGQSVRLVRNVQ